MRLAEHTSAELKRQRRRHGIIHISGFDGDKSVKKFCRRRQAIFPLRARGRIENFAVMLQRLGQRDRVKHGDALPGAQGHVVDPTAVGAAHLGLRPLVHQHRRAQVFGFAGGVRHAQQRIHRIAATAVDERAGGAQQPAIECGIAHLRHLPRQQSVAPCLQCFGVEPFFGDAESTRRPCAFAAMEASPGKAAPAAKTAAPAADRCSNSLRVRSALGKLEFSSRRNTIAVSRLMYTESVVG